MKRKITKRSNSSVKKKGIVKYLGISVFLLLCLIIFTLSQVNDAKSKYKAESISESSATVAKWNVSLSPITEGNVFDVVAGNNSVDYLIKVSSNSQVSCNYTIIISNIPNDISVLLDDDNEQISSNNTVTFTDAGSFIIGDGNEERTHKLSFSAPIDSSDNNKEINIQVAFTQLN